MEKTVTVRVPATSANCGPGFDCMGLALNLYNDFTYTVSDERRGFFLEAEGEGKERLTPSGRNFAFASFLKVWNEATDKKRVGISLKAVNRVPFARGLGSSSTAIVAGVMAASVLSGKDYPKEELLQYANRLEGHPDNVAPAIFGGFTVATQDDSGRAYVKQVDVKLPLTFVAVSPEKPLATKLARAAIPLEVPHKDAVFNASRCALLIASLSSGDDRLLDIALEDRLHQNYRAHLIDGMAEVFAAAQEAGAYKCLISGAGSTLIAWCKKDADKETVARAMQEAFKKAGQDSKAFLLDMDPKGATAEIVQP